jgi:hypothetical protein
MMSSHLVDIMIYKLWYQKVLGMKVHHPLNLVPYVKKNAEDELRAPLWLAAFSAQTPRVALYPLSMKIIGYRVVLAMKSAVPIFPV